MASASTKDYAATLNNLIQTCKDGEEGFRQSAENVKTEQLRKILDDFSRQRATFASELQQEVSRIGFDPQHSGSVSGSLHRGWINLKGSISNMDEHQILEEAERGEDVAVKAYKDALGEDLPTDLRAVVDRQYQKILQAHREVKALRDTFGSGMETAGFRRTNM